MNSSRRIFEKGPCNRLSSFVHSSMRFYSAARILPPGSNWNSRPRHTMRLEK
jgi:hypothetical protein